MAVKFNKTVEDKIENAVKTGVVKATEFLRNKAIDKITMEPKTGRIYKRGKKTHQASAPGEAYATDTGVTMGKIKTTYTPAADGHEGRVIFGGENARRLELGTVKMAPRPVARPTLEENRDKVEKIIGLEVNRVL